MRRAVLTVLVLMVSAGGLVVPGGVVGADKAGADDYACPATPHGAVIDRARQRAWLCAAGRLVRRMPITTATNQPDPGTYAVYAEDAETTSTFGGRSSTLDRFVAFTYGKYQGARIGFHAIPRYGDGTLAQPPESVGSPDRFGASSGCIRLRPEDAVAVWDHLAIGDEVRVLT